MVLTPVLLPGNMCDARLWRGDGDVLIEMLARDNLAGVFDADLSEDDSIATMASRALAATSGQLLPIGFSLGAIVAVEMALQAPERISGLVLAGYNATADLPQRAAHRPAQQAEVRAGGLKRVLVDELKPNYLAAQNRADAALLDVLLAMGMSLGADVFIRQSEALRRRDSRQAAIAALHVPVLYMCGSEDTLCPSVWHRDWAALTVNANFDEIAGAGHMLPLEAPRAFTNKIEQWLTRNEGKFA